MQLHTRPVYCYNADASSLLQTAFHSEHFAGHGRDIIHVSFSQYHKQDLKQVWNPSDAIVKDIT